MPGACEYRLAAPNLEIAGSVKINCHIRDSHARLRGDAMPTTEVVKIYGVAWSVYDADRPACAGREGGQI